MAEELIWKEHGGFEHWTTHSADGRELGVYQHDTGAWAAQVDGQLVAPVAFHETREEAMAAAERAVRWQPPMERV
jgi:hypothetical protein